MIDEVLQHQHPLRADVVEGDSEVTAAVHSLVFLILDVLKEQERIKKNISYFQVYLKYLLSNTRILNCSTPSVTSRNT